MYVLIENMGANNGFLFRRYCKLHRAGISVQQAEGEKAEQDCTPQSDIHNMFHNATPDSGCKYYNTITPIVQT
jgi:hypothetical protein